MQDFISCAICLDTLADAAFFNEVTAHLFYSLLRLFWAEFFLGYPMLSLLATIVRMNFP